jgi:orotate phosphoribosyltransferase
MNSKEVLDLLEWSGAIMKGHFKLTSGRHSNTYIEKFRLLENPVALDKICITMSEKFEADEIDLVVGAAIGGILISGGVGRYLNSKHIFSERVNGEMVFKRGFEVEKKSNVVIVEDIITTGGSIEELIDLLVKYDVNIKGIICIVNRSEKNLDFGYPFISLLNFQSQSWEYENCPDWLKKTPITKPGSTGK